MFDVSKVKRLGDEYGINAYSYQGDLSIDEIKQFKDYIKEMEVTKMTNKFTEEQYHKIVNAWDSNLIYREATQAVIDVLGNDYRVTVDKAIAVANPLTREWAHEQFVEKEKRYFWSTKKKSKKGKAMTLFKSSGGIAQMVGTKHALTESEIKEWGYNPEMFDRYEV